MPELCFNIWYYIDRKQNIIQLSAKAYMLEGTDDEKAMLLKELSRHDYKSVETVPPPDGIRKQYGLNYSVLNEIGVEEMYRVVFLGIHRLLPKDQPFPKDKLFFATPLYDFGEGFVPIEVGDGFIRERD